MLIRHKKPFYLGAFLLVSFAIMFWLMLLPLFTSSEGKKITALQFADQVFNQLSKGSSWFIPQLRQQLTDMPETPVDLTVTFNNAAIAPLAQQILSQAGAKSELGKHALHFTGSLKNILMAATGDAAWLYNNNGEELASRYNIANPLQIAKAWWHLLTPCIKELQKQKKIHDAKLVDSTIRRAIEPGNNFYGIPARNVSENVLILLAFMVFYIFYTLWYGFAIYEIFNGLGLMGGENRQTEEIEEEREEGAGPG